jgi:transposase
MEQLVDRVAGLDVHRDTVVVTVRRPRPGGGRAAKTLTFATTVAELTALGDWLVAEGVELAGMESTGVYWKPVYFLLEERIPQIWLLNAEHLHNVPGRKTDVADSAWIAQLLEHGLVAPSFVPPAPIRRLRDLTRHRRVLIEERTRVIQRLEKALQDAGIKLTTVASTLLTKTGRAILDALLAGISDPIELAELAKGRLRAKIPALQQALRGSFRVEHHGLLVAQMLAHVDFLDESLAELDARIEAAVADYEPVLQRVMTIPGSRAQDRDRPTGRDRRGHERVSHPGAPGLLGRDLPGQQRLRRQAPPGAHPARLALAEDRAHRGRAGRRPHPGHLPGRPPRRHPRPPRHLQGDRRHPPRPAHRLLAHRP